MTKVKFEYKGKEYNIRWSKPNLYVAMDADGDVYAYSKKPTISFEVDDFVWDIGRPPQGTYTVRYLGSAGEAEPLDYKTSLVEIEL